MLARILQKLLGWTYLAFISGVVTELLVSQGAFCENTDWGSHHEDGSTVLAFIVIYLICGWAKKVCGWAKKVVMLLTKSRGG